MTDEDGRFTISGLPPGKHKLTVWHELYRETSGLEVEFPEQPSPESTLYNSH